MTPNSYCEAERNMGLSPPLLVSGFRGCGDRIPFLFCPPCLLLPAPLPLFNNSSQDPTQELLAARGVDIYIENPR